MNVLYLKPSAMRAGVLPFLLLPHTRVKHHDYKISLRMISMANTAIIYTLVATFIEVS